MESTTSKPSNIQESHDTKQLSPKDRIWTSLVAGGLAGALAKSTIAPLDRTKIYFQTNAKEQYSARSAIGFIKRTYTETGFSSLWRGNSATMARIIPYSAIQFTSHEQWKHLLGVDTSPHSSESNSKKQKLLRFLSGSLAGVTAQSFTYPLDMTRARMAIAPKQKYRTLREAFNKIYKEEGIVTLYRGYTATMVGVIPYAGMSFYTYETLKKKWFERHGSLDAPIRLVFGACAGVIGQSSSYPFDIVRRRLQVGQKLNGKGMIGMLIYIGKTEGIVGGLYKGLSMNWIKGPVAAGIAFSVFDVLQQFFRRELLPD